MDATRAINDGTFVTAGELRDIRRALADGGLDVHLVSRITRAHKTLTGETGLLVSEILDRASVQRDQLLSILEDRFGYVHTTSVASHATIAPPPRPRGRPRVVRCCSSRSTAFGGSYTEWPSGACISACGSYRYALWRRSNTTQPTAVFVLKNPSTADHVSNDASTRNCVKSAAKLGLGCEIVNLYPWRGDPDSLLAAGDARYGDRDLNDEHIRLSIRRAKIVVLGFGDFDGPLRQLRADVEHVRTIIDQERKRGHVHEIYALRVTASGAPWHPARLSLAPLPIVYSTWPTWLRSKPATLKERTRK